MIQMQPAIDRIGVTGIQRHLESARQLRMRLPQHHHADRHHEERHQRADARHLGQEVDRDQAGKQRDDDRDDDRVRRPG